MSNSAWQWVVEAKHQFHWFYCLYFQTIKAREKAVRYMCICVNASGEKNVWDWYPRSTEKDMIGGFESCTVKAKKGLYFTGNLEQFD